MSIYKGDKKVAGLGATRRNIGEIVSSILPLTDAGLHLLDGAIISGNGIYGKFVTYIAGLVSSYPNLFISEADWQASISSYGVCGKFVYDSVNNTVRLPKITGMIEGTVSVSALGDLVEAGLPNITGTMQTAPGRGGYFGTGALSQYNTDNATNVYASGSQSTTTQYGMQIDASRSSSIYGKSSTVQPQTIKAYYYICVAASVKPNIEADMDQIATELNGKASLEDLNGRATLDLSNVAATSGFRRLIEVYNNGTSWYKVFNEYNPSTGAFIGKWCEQGGSVNSGVGSVNSGSQVTFLKAFANTNYTITFLSGHDDTSTNNLAVQYGNYYYGCYYPSSKSTTGIKIRGRGTWQACGYIS